MSTIAELKELEQAETPLVLFDITFEDATTRHFSTVACTVGGTDYEERVARHNLFEVQSYSEEGLDRIPRITLVLMNADSQMSQLDNSKGFKGARVVATFLFLVSVGASVSSDTLVPFRGVLNAPESVDAVEMTVSANNQMNLGGVPVPPVRLQHRCLHNFPFDAAERLLAVGDPNSLFWGCGYSPDQTGGAQCGNYVTGTTPYTSCNFTKEDCILRGMWDEDSLARPTRRYSGVQFVPPTIGVRPYGGKWESATGQGPNYHDPFPIAYGTTWVQAPVVALRNDGNFTKFQAILSWGDIGDVYAVVVNDHQVPRATAGDAGWYNIVNTGDRIGDFDLNFTDGSGNPIGDPFGSIAYISVSVPTKLADGQSAPDVKVLVSGRKVETFDSGGNTIWPWVATANPIWIMWDLLKMAGWKASEANMVTFYNAAQYCDAVINQTDNDGNTVSLPRFRCNLAIDKRRTCADVVLGIRNNCRAFFTYSNTGKLQVFIEKTLAEQQASLPYGSNGTALDGGYPAYEYDSTNIAMNGEGPGQTDSLRRFHRQMSETPTSMSVEFSDEFSTPPNTHARDSVSNTDIDERILVGFDVGTSPVIDGLPNYHQAVRQTRWLLDKSVAGNDFVELETSVKGVHHVPGQIIAITHAREGWTRQPFRIIKLAPKQNFRRVGITAQVHDDAWYTDSATAPPRKQPRHQLREYLTPPTPYTYPRNENYGKSAYDVLDGVWEADSETGGNSEVIGGDQLLLRLSVRPPERRYSPVTGPPQVDLQATVETTGGYLAGGQTLYYRVYAEDSDHVLSPSSWIIVATIPATTNTNKVTLTGLKFDSSAAYMAISRGRTPATYLTRTGRTVASSFVDDGVDPTYFGIIRPDPNVDRIQGAFRRVLKMRQSSLAAIATFNVSTIKATSPGWTTNQFAGCKVEIVKGPGLGQIRGIASNDTDTLTLSENFAFAPDTGTIFVIHNKVTASSATTITDSGLDLTGEDWTGRVVRITSGKGLYQERLIASHTSGGAVTISAPWTITPDSTSSWIISDSQWTWGPGLQLDDRYSGTLFVDLPIPNEPGLLIELTMRSLTAEGVESLPMLAPVSRYRVAGFTVGGGAAVETMQLYGQMAVVSAPTPALRWSYTTPSSIYATVETAPTGAALLITVKKNGSSYTTLTIAAGATASETDTGLGSAADGDLFTFDITQVGSTYPGWNLTVNITP